MSKFTIFYHRLSSTIIYHWLSGTKALGNWKCQKKYSSNTHLNPLSIVWLQYLLKAFQITSSAFYLTFSKLKTKMLHIKYINKKNYRVSNVYQQLHIDNRKIQIQFTNVKLSKEIVSYYQIEHWKTYTKIRSNIFNEKPLRHFFIRKKGLIHSLHIQFELIELNLI